MFSYFISAVVCAYCISGVSSGDLPAIINVTATPSSFMMVLDREVEVHCKLAVNGSGLRSVISLILSKTAPNDTDNLFSEIASITEYDRDTVAVRNNSMGAEATGQVMPGHDAFISLKWTYPNSSVAGKFKCEAFGVDRYGHPVTNSGVVVVEEKTVDIPTALDKVKQLNKQVDEAAKYKELSGILLKNCHGGADVFSEIQTFNGHCYLLNDPTKVSSAAAQTVCQGYGGYIAEVNDSEEYHFIQHMLTDKFGSTDTWTHLGATDVGHEGSWTYLTSGSPVTFEDWGPSTSKSSNYNCMYLHLQGGKWQMEDGGCKEATHAVLCEMEV